MKRVSTTRHPDLPRTMSAQLLLRLGRACAACCDEAGFAVIVRSLVRPLLPHGHLAAVIGRLDMEHLEILRFVGVDYPAAALQQLPLQINLRERPVVKKWLLERQPLVIDLPDDEALTSERERHEIVAFNLGRLAIHGVIDLAARMGSYFSFGQTSLLRPRADLLATLELLVPYLHQALVNVHRAAPTRPGEVEQLTSTERDLLQWVAAGRTNEEIAALRGRSAATVRNQLHNVYRKLGVAGRAEAVRLLSSGP